MQAIEFWSTVCDCETSVLEDIRDGVENPPLYLKLVERAAPMLVPIMLETLTKQQVCISSLLISSSFSLFCFAFLFFACTPSVLFLNLNSFEVLS